MQDTELRPTRSPLVVGLGAWLALALSFAYLYFPRRVPALSAWDAGLQIAALFVAFVVLPFVAIHTVDLFRAAVAEHPEDEARHRLGLTLSLAAGAGAVAAWLALALAAA